MTQRNVQVLVLVLALLPLALAAGKNKLDPKCPRDQAIMAFQKVVKANGGAIDTVHTKNGLIVLVTAPTEKGAKAIQSAAAQYDAAAQKVMASKENVDAHCLELLRLVQQGQVSAETDNIGAGVMFVYTANDASKTVTVQDDCCKWCVCPTTNYRCAHCC